MFDLEARNNKIRENGKLTRQKRANQTCKTFKFKIDKSHLRKDQIEWFKMSMVEAKWIYNYMLANDGTDTDYKTLTTVTHKDKDKNDIVSEIKHLGTSVRQELIQQIRNQIKGLSELKKKGHDVGKLRFKSEFRSLKFKQYNNTHFIRGHRIKLQGCKRLFYITGLKQLEKYDNIDYTTANLIYNGYDYFICLTCFIDKKDKLSQAKKDKLNIVGIDLGVTDNITLSNGDKINSYVEETERMKRLQRKLSRQVKRSNNWYKTKSLINKEYAHICNKKADISNKLVSKLRKEYDLIVTQDDNISGWKEQYHKDKNKTIHHSILGRVKSNISKYNDCIMLERWFPTTQFCTKCGHKTPMPEEKRTFVCSNCGYEDDRDVHAANNMIWFALTYMRLKNIKDTEGTFDTSKLVTNKSAYKISFKEFCKLFAAEQETVTSLV